MFRIIRFDLLLKYIALTTVVISMGIYTFVQTYWLPNISLFKVITISSIVSTFIILLLLTSFISRKIWAILAWFDKSMFPDLNGTWEGEIILEGGKEIPAKAVIRQTLLTTQIDMHGETTKSITLETTPTLEQGQKKLYYVYRSTPRTPGWPAYNGSTLFDIRALGFGKEKKYELSGHYYTDRKTIGRIRLTQICKDSNNDVSFY
ncbi:MULTISPECIES: Cap15 family CBASS effector [Pseudoalteromonas]|uniref:Cap15 family cyclic dinucleotide receptor domain-containing protein n=1 Tax=Pseudoalteromonas TaxID=53246 RepID=UPI0030018010